jgi:hypothetical protein
MTPILDWANDHDRRIERLVMHGRIFVTRGAALEAVLEAAADAGVPVTVRWGERHGWWVTFTEEEA